MTDPAVACMDPNWKYNDFSGLGAIATGTKEKSVRLI